MFCLGLNKIIWKQNCVAMKENGDGSMKSMSKDEENVVGYHSNNVKKVRLNSTLAALLDDPILADVPKNPTLSHVDTLISLELGSAMRISVLKLDGTAIGTHVFLMFPSLSLSGIFTNTLLYEQLKLNSPSCSLFRCADHEFCDIERLEACNQAESKRDGTIQDGASPHFMVLFLDSSLTQSFNDRCSLITIPSLLDLQETRMGKFLLSTPQREDS